MAVANVFEGSLVRYRADQRDGTDRRAFARRFLGRSAVMPDVVLLQEVLGTAGLMARTLTTHPRAVRTGTRYVRLGSTDHRFVTGHCDGRRSGRFSVLRSSAIIINARTVTAVHKRGVVRNGAGGTTGPGMPPVDVATGAPSTPGRESPSSTRVRPTGPHWWPACTWHQPASG